MKNASFLALENDSKRSFFHKIVESLHFFEDSENWDLSWGEPFLAVSKDKRVWVRVFYEESLPVSQEKLKHEVARLRPHIPHEGELLFCVPQSWKMDLNELVAGLRIWSYHGSPETSVISRELVVKEAKRSPLVLAPDMASSPHLPERLSPEEIRELTEMGIAFKRHALRAS